MFDRVLALVLILYLFVVVGYLCRICAIYIISRWR